MLDNALITPVSVRVPIRTRARGRLPSRPTPQHLPTEDNEPMDTERHRKQMELLIDSLQPWLDQQPQGGYVSGNMFVYYSANQTRRDDFKGPDVFVVLGVPHTERRSWVVWEENKGPDVVIELLSETTAKTDKEKKKQIYQTQLKAPEYFWFDPFNPSDLTGFRLSSGVYQELQLDSQGRLFSPSLGLTLRRWQGVFKNIDTTWLRWATLDGELLLLPAEAEAQRADTEAQRAATEAQRAAAEAQRAAAEAQRADAEAQRADTEAQRADAEAQRADLAEQQAQAAAQQAQAATAEIALLKALLAKTNQGHI